MPTHIVYVLLNRVLNILVRKKFGKQISARLNSLRFIDKRASKLNMHNYSKKIILKSLKPVTINELNQINKYLLLQIDSDLKCIDSNIYPYIEEIELLIS